MRAVLYADDMEPITVVELPEFAEEYLAERGMVRLAVMRPPEWVIPATQPPKFEKLTTVTIVAERLVRNGRAHMMLFTRDEESALLLKCAFLPGQQAGLQEREREAFARGFLEALMKLGAA